MAQTITNKIRAKYNQDEARYKQEYAEKNGTLRGYKNSDEKKKWQKNKRRALLNYSRQVQGTRAVKLPATNIQVIASGMPFFSVLSYGSETEKIAMEVFRIEKSVSKNPIAIIDATAVGGEVEHFFTIYEYQKGMKKAYKLARKEQGKSKSYPTVTVLAGKKGVYDAIQVIIEK